LAWLLWWAASALRTLGASTLANVENFIGANARTVPVGETIRILNARLTVPVGSDIGAAVSARNNDITYPYLCSLFSSKIAII